MKNLLALLLLIPALVFGQSYPSPTYQNLTVLGTLTNTHGVALAALPQQAANTGLGNVTGSTANVAAFSLPSCSTSSSALSYTSGTGFACNTAINAATLGAATFASPGPIGSTTAATGAFTTLSASSTVSGAGFGLLFASPPAIGQTAANTGAFTTLSSTGTFTPSQTNGIVGTTAANNANTGSVGEYLAASASAISVSTGTPTTVTSESLTAGDWDVSGIVAYAPAGGATLTQQGSGINTATNAFGAFGTNTQMLFTSGASIGSGIPTPVVRISIASTTTVFLIGQANFSSGTCTMTGVIRARRVR